MIQIDDKLIADDILQKKFVCDLAKCKGACCIEGDSGAPLEEEETALLEAIYPKVEPYLRPEGKHAIKHQGTFVVDFDGEYVTPLINGKECAYVVFDKNSNTAQCAIELAYNDKKIKFKKPISCHLYPIRVTKTKTGYILNYHEWKICKAACKLGDNLKIYVYEFLKEPLIRKFGKRFYNKIQLSKKLWDKTNGL
jgi:hypothetical protein